MKVECPNQKNGEERNTKKFFTKKKTYIAWDDDNESTSGSSDSDEQANVYLLANENIYESQISSKSKKSMWYLDNGCSRHMTGDKRKLTNFRKKKQGYVTYSDNNQGKILGIGDIRSENTLVIKDVLFVEGLKHNLLSISQLCDQGLK
ncbi:uncharacterized protein LOC124824794, partial [Vigna umbellata]|uniref:uncharacterized protein LOC124824794 n=1 Tax=Vigna umbellata TaxID=87088 RepID=UPI001F5F3FC5